MAPLDSISMARYAHYTCVARSTFLPLITLAVCPDHSTAGETAAASCQPGIKDSAPLPLCLWHPQSDAQLLSLVSQSMIERTFGGSGRSSLLSSPPCQCLPRSTARSPPERTCTQLHFFSIHDLLFQWSLFSLIDGLLMVPISAKYVCKVSWPQIGTLCVCVCPCSLSSQLFPHSLNT